MGGKINAFMTFIGLPPRLQLSYEPGQIVSPCPLPQAVARRSLRSVLDVEGLCAGGLAVLVERDFFYSRLGLA